MIFATSEIEFDDTPELQDADILMKIVVFTSFQTEFDDAPESTERQSDENRNFYDGSN